MGRILQIRVSAWTYDPDEVVAAWPGLSALVWSQLDRWGPVGVKHGVAELAEYLPDALRFSDLPKNVKAELKPGAAKVGELLEQLRSALADWDPRKADRISHALEDALTELEKEFPRELLKD